MKWILIGQVLLELMRTVLLSHLQLDMFYEYNKLNQNLILAEKCFLIIQIKILVIWFEIKAKWYERIFHAIIIILPYVVGLDICFAEREVHLHLLVTCHFYSRHMVYFFIPICTKKEQKYSSNYLLTMILRTQW